MVTPVVAFAQPIVISTGNEPTDTNRTIYINDFINQCIQFCNLDKIFANTYK